MPTGLYRVSIKNRLRQARVDVVKCEKSLTSLKNQDSEYAHEHRALLAVLKAVENIYANAHDSILLNEG